MAKKKSPSKRKTVGCRSCGRATSYDARQFKRSNCPCASCGRLPAFYVLNRRGNMEFLLALIGGGVLLLVTVMTIFSWLTIGTWTTIAALTGAVMMVGHFLASKWDPNSDDSVNRDRIQDLLSSGTIAKAGRMEDPAERVEATGLTSVRSVKIVAAGAVLCLMMVPVLFARLNGWVANERLGIVGPGDSFTVYFANQRESLGGRWSGSTAASLGFSGGETIRLPDLTASTKQQKFGNEINSVGSNRFHPWSKVTLPDHPELVHRKIQIHVSLSVQYPQTVSGSEFMMAGDSFGESFDIDVSTPRAGTKYRIAWYVCGLGGAVALVLLSFSLAKTPHEERPA